MSYRTVKRLLGETSLERKCRFLFGGGLMLLITGSFYFYAQLNLKVIRRQHRQRAELLISQNLQNLHWELSWQDPETIPIIRELNKALKPRQLREYNWKFISADPQETDPSKRHSNLTEADALNRLLSDDEYVVHEDRESGNYEYFGPVVATESCLKCHNSSDRGIEPVPVATRGGTEIFGTAKITFPLSETQRDIAQNNAILIAMAIVTAFLAMVAAYAIVRYVIVKPVLHLKDVSDAIAHGDLDQRADIRTGDEFEELSHAYNRMLRHLVNIQEELRQVNASLDAKVDELAQANLSLHEMNKLKNEFLATMSHELRTPLNSILGFSDVLADSENLNDRQKRYVSNIRSSGQNLLALINDILDLAKIEAGKMDLHLTEFSIHDLVERLVGSMLPLAEKKNIDMQWSVAPDVPTSRQDAGKMQQTLYNLLSNAVKFTPEGGRIRVQGLMADENTVELVVADTGIGIPLEDQGKIFEKFRQGRNLPGQQDTLTREYEGTGLGLSIVKELTRLLGGEILLESEFGKGSTFIVRLPVTLQAPLTEDQEPLRQQTIELRRQLKPVLDAMKEADPPARETG
ncbi:Signal transduction histidine-protein kinase BarA [Maioricimonas rarisocia]|uniref:histidine kinase n=1 Tax=Maioricimonas rarisocia TaxID=2528026 RepID=A0A517Z7X7_9PLAN|nr:ATP-binding protein [Maioricimonas rarisocia]QDU38574.1 Signal transduction histidine-protein kinase BarA [Maioricimonas rarisocia]